jgi:hypothetical protein
MSDISSAAESVSSSASSIAVKTTLVGGAGLGVPSIVPMMQAKLIVFSGYALTPADICQVLATMWIISQAYIAIKKLLAKKPKPKESEKVRAMGGSGGGGPEEENGEDE